jgi:murein DD-endopeptidase MepM/ murein hydrolase activator NlpD
MAARLGAAAALLAVLATTTLTGTAAGRESLSDLKARMSDIQAELNANQAKIEKLRTEEDTLRQRLSEIDIQTRELTAKRARLRGRVIHTANILYKSGHIEMLEVLISSRNVMELSNRAEMLAALSQKDNAAVFEYTRTQAQLESLSKELADKQEELADTRLALDDEVDRLQGAFAEVSSEYKDLLAQIRAQQQQQLTSAAPAGAPVSVPIPKGDMTCPVAGPHSFVDSWGAPRSGGRTHEGTDIMADYGTPVVAVVSGAITYAGYGSSSGNWLILSGSDGNTYWYMHHQRNIVTSGQVSVGQLIAEVGDTGNATGIPHLHFEYHPGGGGPVNPYPLLVGIC